MGLDTRWCRETRIAPEQISVHIVSSELANSLKYRKCNSDFLISPVVSRFFRMRWQND